MDDLEGLADHLRQVRTLKEEVTSFQELLRALDDIRGFPEEVEESKALHTHSHLDYHPATRDRVVAHDQKFNRNPDRWREKKHHLRTTANRQYDAVKAKFRLALRDAVFGYQKGKYSQKEFERVSRAAFDEAYASAYRLGLKASGVALLDHPRKRTAGPNTQYHDDKWIKSSLRDERKYWNKFMSDVTTGAIEGKRFTAAERIDMYADTLDHVYDAARVVGHPSHSIIYWVMHKEKEHCSLCLFLQENSPYTRETLPGVPRDGNTCMGLSRCGCELRIVTLDDDTLWQSLRKRSRERLTRELARLRKVGRSTRLDSTVFRRRS